MSRPCAVYRAYDAGGTLLYVGSSVTPDARLRNHERHSMWWPFMAEVHFEWFDDETSARLAELTAIAREYPRWNVAGRAGDHPDGLMLHYRADHMAEDVAAYQQWRQAEIAANSAAREMNRATKRIASIVARRTRSEQAVS